MTILLENFSPFLAVSQRAQTIPWFNLSWFTNSTVIAILTTILIVIISQIATRNIRRIPGPVQNFFELLVDRKSVV